MKYNLASILSNTDEIKSVSIRESFRTGIQEHRMECIGKSDGVTYVNDSKATNVRMTWYALESIPAPIIWICGGISRGESFDILKELVKEKVKLILVIGNDHKTAKQIESSFAYTNVIAYMPILSVAVGLAMIESEKNDTILLSPACASFDQYKNYEDRGQQFKQIISTI